MSADEMIREAATKLRALAQDATPGPWRDSSVDGLNRYAALVSDVMPEGRLIGKGWDWDDGYGGYLIGESIQAQDRAYIATMNPVLARALADLLDAHANGFEFVARNEAILITRLINGDT